jgi:putative ABC transport system substrate-binding protein
MWYSTIGGIITLLLGLLATPGAIAAQPAQHVPRIGFLSGSTPAANAARVAAFRQGLRELGYVEGHNLVIE